MASWATRTPAIRDILSVSIAEMGGVLFGLSIGSMSGILCSAWLVKRFGTRNVILVTMSCALIGMMILSLALWLTSPLLFAVGLGVFGASFGSAEVAINVEGAAVEREIAFLIDDFAHELTRIESMQHIHDSEDLKVLANILMDASFNWAMRWIGLSRDVAPEKLQQQQAAFKLQTIVQIQLMFRGISNWQRPSAQTKHANPTLH